MTFILGRERGGIGRGGYKEGRKEEGGRMKEWRGVKGEGDKMMMMRGVAMRFCLRSLGRSAAGSRVCMLS